MKIYRQLNTFKNNTKRDKKVNVAEELEIIKMEEITKKI